MDEEDLYDEFGNLIGDALDSDAESVEEETSKPTNGQQIIEDDDSDDAIEVDSRAIILPEDRRYYNSLTETFGEDVETVIHTSDAQSISVPIVKPITEKKLKIDSEVNLPELAYSREYMLNLMRDVPQRIRNVTVAGHLHSGKTSLLDMLVLQTHPSLNLSKNLKSFEPLRYMDNHKLEISKGISIKASPITLLLPDLKEKSYVFNFIDTPGHVNFFDEVAVANTTSDGVLLVVDAVEGINIGGKMAITDALRNNIPLCVVINKLDRLILELRLPPSDAYYKLRYTIEEINTFIQESEYLINYTHEQRVSPELNNVCFASSSLEFCFNLKSFAQMYLDQQDLPIDVESLSKRLWGDIYFNEADNKFSKNSNKASIPRTFNYFILEPLYKIFSSTISCDSDKLKKLLWNNFRVKLPNHTYKLDVQILLKEACRAIFGEAGGLVDVLTQSIPSPIDNSSSKLEKVFSNSSSINGDFPLVHITKLIESADGKKFYALARVYSGSLKLKNQVKVLGERFFEEEEDFKIESIEELYLPGGRYRVPVEEIPTGGICLIGGIDSKFVKSSTIHGATTPSSELGYFLPINYIIGSVFKVAIEPKIPSELPRMMDGLRKISKSYPGSIVKTEDSFETVVFSSGEMYMDCLLHDLRHFFTDDLEIKVSDPMTQFNETVVRSSVMKITTNSISGNNKISIIAEPIDDEKLISRIELGKIDLSKPIREVAKTFRNEFKWDALSSRSVWCFGQNNSPNILQDDTLESEVDKKLLFSVKDPIVQGFQWAIQTGPLCEEPIRNTKFKILDVVLSELEPLRGYGDVVPMVRRACYAGMLTAEPKLMEPVYSIHIICTSNAIKPVIELVEKRRGSILRDSPLPATQLYNVFGYVPVIDSVGLESDIRVATQGQAACHLTFEKWDIVPGDPLDGDAFIPKLRPAPIKSLARDFVMKTRKRKGLSGEPTLSTHIDDSLAQRLKETGYIL